MSDKPDIVGYHISCRGDRYLDFSSKWKGDGLIVHPLIRLSDHEASRIDDKARIEDLENLLKAHYSKQFFIHRDDI